MSDESGISTNRILTSHPVLIRARYIDRYYYEGQLGYDRRLPKKGRGEAEGWRALSSTNLHDHGPHYVGDRTKLTHS